MKKLIPMLLALALLAGCGAEQPGNVNEMISEPEMHELDQKSNVAEEPTDFTLSAEWTEYDPSMETIWFTLENHSGADVETGVDYTLERFVESDLAWDQVPMVENAGWEAIALCVPNGGSIALSCHLGMYDHDFSDGTYRIVKEVEGQTCTAEFRLKTGAAISADTPYGFKPLENLPDDYGADTAAEADVVFTGDGVRNDGLAEEFLHKVSLGVPCQLRTVQDYGEGAVMVIDVIFENHSFLWRMRQDGYVTERRFSYIVTDGADLYLSNGADWENTTERNSEKAFLLPEGTANRLVPAVEAMTASRLEGNIARYRVWSADGVWSAMLTENPTEFGVSWQKPGQGSGGSLYDLQDWDGLETSIWGLEWQEDGKLLLRCGTVDGSTSRLTFDPESGRLG